MAIQRGLVTRRQAVAAGMTDSAIRHLVRRGVWRRVRDGLYVLNGTPLTWEHDVLGAVLLTGHPAWGSHFTSARFWGYSDLPELPIELTVPLERRVRITGVRTHRSGTLHEHDLRNVDGAPSSRPRAHWSICLPG